MIKMGCGGVSFGGAWYTGHKLRHMGPGTARGGRLPCKQDIQVGSIPTGSTKIFFKKGVTDMKRKQSDKESDKVNKRFPSVTQWLA